MRIQDIAGVAIALAAAGACDRTPDQAAIAPPTLPIADHVFLNGFIYTADEHGTVAQALAVRGDRIIFVGGNSEARTYVGESTRVQGLDGKTVLPGLHDAHIHLLGLLEPNYCDLKSQPMALEELARVLKACFPNYPLQKGWMVVGQWNFADGNQPSEELPTMRAALDTVSRDVPIFLRGNDGHHAAVNSKALARAVAPNGKTVGLSARTLRLQLRVYRHYIGVDARGEPDGYLNESARLLVQPPDVWGFSGTESARVRELPPLLARSGLTSVQDAAMSPENLSLFEELARLNRMTFRLTAALYPDFDEYRDPRTRRVDIDAIIEELRRTRDHFRGHPTIKATVAKIYLDGVIEGNPLSDPPALPNAAVLKPYRQPQFRVDRQNNTLELLGYVDPDSDVCIQARSEWERFFDTGEAEKFRAVHGIHPRQCEISYGVLEHDEAFIRNYLRALQENEFVIHAHAIGDRAVRVVAANLQALRAEFGESRLPHTIAHAQLVHPSEQTRLGRLGACIAFTYAWIGPQFRYDMSVNPFISRLEGNEMLYDMQSYVIRNSYPARSLLEAGAVLVAGSDAPVDTRDPRPFVNMARAVTRANEDGQVFNAGERISIHDVIVAYTRNGARALQQEDLSGSIQVGKKADLIVISQNIVDLAEHGDAARIADTEVLLTMFDGKVIYQSN